MKNRVVGQQFVGNHGDYRNLVLVDCQVMGNHNKVSTMVGGEIVGNHNRLEYSSGTTVVGNHNKIKNYFNNYEEKKLRSYDSRSNLPDDIREALEIKDEAVAFQKEVVEKTAKIEKRKSDYFKKYGTLAQKCKEYLTTFYK